MEDMIFIVICLFKFCFFLEFLYYQWDVVDDIYRLFMVDYVIEVSQWMVGVKRLIVEKKSLFLEEIKEEKFIVEFENQIILGF